MIPGSPLLLRSLDNHVLTGGSLAFLFLCRGFGLHSSNTNKQLGFIMFVDSNEIGGIGFPAELFNMGADSSLDPIWVQGRGAAIKAATIQLPGVRIGVHCFLRELMLSPHFTQAEFFPAR